MTEEMRILTVRQPWAWAIIHGGKDVENRVRNIAGDYRGLVAIHVALRWDAEEDGSVEMSRDQLTEAIRTKGSIIGVVDLEEVHSSPYCYNAEIDQFCSRCGLDNAYHLRLSKPRPLAEPIPFKGALGLRRLDEETIQRVLAGIS